MRIALLTKDQFVSLLRMGRAMVPECQSVEIVAANVEDAVRKLLKKCLVMGPLEDIDSSIFIVYMECHIPSSIAIEYVRLMIPATKDAQLMYIDQFSSSLAFSDPVYENIANEYANEGLLRRQAELGIFAVRRLFGLGDLVGSRKIVDRVIKAYSYRKQYRYLSRMPEECFSDPYVDMVVYERYEPYPNDLRGYFCDAVELYSHIHMPGPFDLGSKITETKIYKCLINATDWKTLEDIHKIVREQPFASQCSEKFPDGGYLVPVLYFMMRDILRKSPGFTAFRSAVTPLLESTDSEIRNALPIALNYLAAFMGYSTFYDSYYVSARLPIIKAPKATAKQEPAAEAPKAAIQQALTAKKPKADAKEESAAEETVFDRIEKPKPTPKKSGRKPKNAKPCQPG